MKHARNEPLINGALIALGAIAVIDNTIGHWVLELHRIYPGEYAFEVELAFVVLGVVLFTVGLWREVRARRGRSLG
jgi:uncharacterized membrane protein